MSHKPTLLSLFYAMLLPGYMLFAQRSYDATNCGSCTTNSIKTLEDAVNLSDGVIGLNPKDHTIGRHAAIKDDLPFFGKNWYPLRPDKQILRGKLMKFEVFDGLSDEMDWNIYILPDAEYEGLIADAAPYKFVHVANRFPGVSFSNDNWHDITVNGRKKILIEAEITPDEKFYSNPWFPKNGPSPLINRKICVYGPHVREESHGSRPEIHPCEQIWWRDEEESYYLMLILDDSNRFDTPEDFGYGTVTFNNQIIERQKPRNWKPWATEDGLTGSFKIAFQFDPAKDVRNFRIDVTDSHELNRETLNQDIDDGSEHGILYNGRQVLTVTEPVGLDEKIGVTFESVCYNTQKNKLQGFIVITATVGNGPGKEGYLTMRVDRAKARPGATIVKEWQQNSGHKGWERLRTDPDRTSAQEMIFSDYRGRGIVDGIIDFDGNGKSDVFKKTNNDWFVSRDGTSEWIKINQSSTPLRNLRFGHFDGNRKTDVFTSDDNGDWQISYDGTGRWTKVNHSIHGIGKLRVGDFNGDGKTDIFGSDLSEYKFKVQYGATTRSWIELKRPIFPIGNHILQNNMVRFSIDDLRFGDFNGDNKTDVMVLYYNFPDYSRKDTWWVSWGGNTNWEKLRKDDKRVPFGQMIFGNFDAGSKTTDILWFDNSNWYYSFNAKSNWARVSSAGADILTTSFGDFNGDSVLDAFRAKNATIGNEMVFVAARNIPARNVVTKNTYVKNSLKRVSVNGNPVLTMDVDLKAIDASGDRNKVIAKARNLSNRPAVNSPAFKSSSGTTELTNVNVLAAEPTKYELETSTGQKINTQIPVFSITSAISKTDVTSSVVASEVFWQILRRFAGGSNLKAPPRQDVVKEIQLTVIPFYGAVKKGTVSIGDEAALTQEINEAISKDNSSKIKDLFGNEQPFIFDWTFEAFDLATGSLVPFVVNQNAAGKQIRIDVKKGRFDKNIISIQFMPGDKIYLVNAKCTVKDSYGKIAVKSFPIWNYYCPITGEQLKLFIANNTSRNRNFEEHARALAEDEKYSVSELVLLLQSF